MKRFILVIVGVVSLAAVAGAVFVGARLLNTPGEETGLLTVPGGGEEFIVSGKGGGGPGLSAGGKAFKLEFKPAPELPQTPPEVAGLYDHREDNSIFVGTGKIEVMVKKDQATGQVTSDSSYDGPVLEVVVTGDTTLYLDTTKMPSPDAVNGAQTIQQTVKPVDSLDDLSENTQIQVWGRRSGDRVVAEVLVYKPMEG